MLSTSVDYTVPFNANGKVNLDISGWDNVDAHIITPTGTVTFNGTNDGGAIEGSLEGSAVSATNFVNVLGTNQTTGSTATSTASSGIFRFQFPARYLQFISTGQTVAKLIVYFSKIN